jgi:hypothetical protein
MTSDQAAVTHIANEIHTTNHTDGRIASDLAVQGLHISKRQVKAARLQQGWRRRAADSDQLAAQRARTYALVKALLKEGTIRCWGRQFVQTKLRIHHQHQAREEDVRDALQDLDLQGTSARRPGPPRRHKGGEFITPGPDWLWSIDGHDKFRNYGIEIYAAVDVYSRRIQWFYIGNSNRRGVSVLRQGLAAIRSYRRCPSFFRSDRGTEVLLLADAHYSFYTRHKKSQNSPQEELDNLRLRDCYMFGTSTANIKIESVWMRTIRSQTAPWLVSNPIGQPRPSSARGFSLAPKRRQNLQPQKRSGRTSPLT